MKKKVEVAFWNMDEETGLDEYTPKIEVKTYYVDLEDTIVKNSSSEFQNDKIFISNTIRVFADLFLKSNWPSIRYVIMDGIKYNVATIKPTYPRLQIDLGGVYNGEE